MVAVITNLVLALAVLAVMVSDPIFGTGGSLLFAAGVGAVGLAFAGFTALTVQLTEYSRAAAGMAGVGLGAAFVLRAGGDMAAEGGSALSWLSPLAWSQQTAPFVLDRWWPLTLSVGFAIVAAALGYLLSVRRDLGAGLLAVRTGPARAAAWLQSSLALAWRLQRAAIVGWAAALAAGGLGFGAFADAMVAGDDLPETILEVMGAQEDIIAGYLSFMAMFMALIVGIFAILSVQSLRAEETSGRGEPVLGTPVSRWAWLGNYLGVSAAAVVALLAITGAATGLGAALVTGNSAHIWDLTLAHVAHAPAVLVVLGLAGLLFGLAPRLIPLTWALLGYGLITGVFGTLLEVPQWVYGLSPFEHVARLPLESFTLAPVVFLAGIAAAMAALGLVAFRQRGINVT